MDENKILNELVLPYLVSLGYQRSSIIHNLPTQGGQDIKVGDLVVYNNGLPYFVVEVKPDIPEKSDLELLKFHPYVRKLQSQASALNTRYYLLTDGHSFLWFTTDTAGRPMLLDNPVSPTSERDYKPPIRYSKEAVIQILRTLQDYLLIRGGSTQLKELTILFVMAQLLSEQGDNWLKEQLLNRRDIQVDSTGLFFLNLFDYSFWERIQLDQVFEILDRISFSSVNSKDLLSALDDILMDRRNRFHEQRVARWLSDLLVHLGQVKAQSNNVVLDIACGSGDILTAVTLNSKETPAWGISFGSESTLWSQLQLVVLGQNREAILRGRVPPYDILSSQRLPRPTHIITAPQFGVRVNRSDSSYLYEMHSQLYSEGVHQMEDMYLELAINWIVSNGRIVILVPEGMLFSSDRRQATRRFMLKNSRVVAIISLDSGVLLPYSSIKTSILVLDKVYPQDNYDVFMARIDGNAIGDTFQSTDVTQVSEVLNRFERWIRDKKIESDRFGWIVPLNKLDVNNLTVNHYLSFSLSDSAQQNMLARMLSLKHVASIIKRGANIKLNEEGTIPVIGPAAIRPMLLDNNGLGKTTLDGLPPQSLTVQSGDVLLNNIGTYLGSAAIVSEDLAGSYISRHVILIRPDTSQVLPAYLAAAINSDYVRSQIQQRATGSVMLALTLNMMEQVTIPVPDFEMQRNIIQKIEKAKGNLILAQENLVKAENNFTALLQKLNDGELNMNVLFHISKDALIKTYIKIKSLLDGNDAIIFNAWNTVITNNHGKFVLPSHPHEFAQKHVEIENRLKYINLLSGRELMMSLMEEIWRQVLVLGGVPGLYNNDLLAVMGFQDSSEEVIIYLTSDSHWAVKWFIALHSKNIKDDSEITLEIQDRNWGEIVPLHVLQFIHTAINAYKQGMYASAITLLSICLESTLRDVLVTKGYSFDPTASSVDEYPYTEADIGVNGSTYTIAFKKGMPKSPNDFLLTMGSTATVEIKIRRIINQRKKGRVDLAIIAPLDFIDYWSQNVPSKLAQKRVNGLGEALDIARRKEGFLTPDVLPEDFDEVIKVIRNNLIHSSENSLNVPLNAYDPPGHFTLKDFIDDQLKVYDLMVYVPKFINDQYVELRKSGHLAP